MGIFFLLISLGFVLYPTISNEINNIFNEGKINSYSDKIDSMSSEEIDKYLSKAQDYNELISHSTRFGEVDSERATEYEDILNIDNGIIGTLEIPKINVNLPIYHGTDEEALSLGAGHMPDSSFPIGGESTHCIISAHTAYPGKEFFNDLPDLEEGDEFYIKVLFNTYKYRVCEINIVSPDDTSKLGVVEGKDYVSLLTCYPYAVNSHRLIVTGERVIDTEEVSTEVAETVSNTKNNTLVNILIVLFIVGVILLMAFLFNRKKLNS